jgi:ribosomal protein L21
MRIIVSIVINAKLAEAAAAKAAVLMAVRDKKVLIVTAEAKKNAKLRFELPQQHRTDISFLSNISVLNLR